MDPNHIPNDNVTFKRRLGPDDNYVYLPSLLECANCSNSISKDGLIEE